MTNKANNNSPNQAVLKFINDKSPIKFKSIFEYIDVNEKILKKIYKMYGTNEEEIYKEFYKK